jgi:prepilin signal peptidase PulO-like enzyme (type II secretory pathway)
MGTTDSAWLPPHHGESISNLTNRRSPDILPGMLFAILPTDWIVVGIVAGFLIPIIVIDLQKLIIPDALVFPGIIVVFAYYALTDPGKIPPALVHGATGFAIILIFWFFSKKQIGLGDAKLSFFLAAGLGFFEWWGALLAACLTAIAFGLVKIRTGRMTLKHKLPLAPFFGVGVALVIVLKAILFGTLRIF